MVSLITPSTLTRVAVFNGCLEDAIHNFDKGFEPLLSLLGNTSKFGIYKTKPEPYLMIVSQQIDKIIDNIQGIDYNTILTITSDSRKYNCATAEEFEQKTNIHLIDAPKSLSEMMANIDSAFPIFKEHGSNAMAVLKGF